jgi:superfamily I DNA and/or RNA helicase
MDTRRLNVAITRAKVKLVMVGDRQTLLMDFEPFKKEIVKLKSDYLVEYLDRNYILY